MNCGKPGKEYPQRFTKPTNPIWQGQSPGWLTEVKGNDENPQLRFGPSLANHLLYLQIPQFERSSTPLLPQPSIPLFLYKPCCRSRRIPLLISFQYSSFWPWRSTSILLCTHLYIVNIRRGLVTGSLTFKMMIGNVYFIAALSVVGGALFGFDISSMSAIISTDAYLCYFDQGGMIDGKCTGPTPNVQGMSIFLQFSASMSKANWIQVV